MFLADGAVYACSGHRGGVRRHLLAARWEGSALNDFADLALAECSKEKQLDVGAPSQPIASSRPRSTRPRPLARWLQDATSTGGARPARPVRSCSLVASWCASPDSSQRRIRLLHCTPCPRPSRHRLATTMPVESTGSWRSRVHLQAVTLKTARASERAHRDGSRMPRPALTRRSAISMRFTAVRCTRRSRPLCAAHAPRRRPSSATPTGMCSPLVALCERKEHEGDARCVRPARQQPLYCCSSPQRSGRHTQELRDIIYIRGSTYSSRPRRCARAKYLGPSYIHG